MKNISGEAGLKIHASTSKIVLKSIYFGWSETNIAAMWQISRKITRKNTLKKRAWQTHGRTHEHLRYYYMTSPTGASNVLSSAYAGRDCVILSSALSFKDGMPPAAPAEGLGFLAWHWAHSIVCVFLRQIIRRLCRSSISFIIYRRTLRGPSGGSCGGLRVEWIVFSHNIAYESLHKRKNQFIFAIF